MQGLDAQHVDAVLLGKLKSTRMISAQGYSSCKRQYSRTPGSLPVLGTSHFISPQHEMFFNMFATSGSSSYVITLRFLTGLLSFRRSASGWLQCAVQIIAVVGQVRHQP
jgi:hypothetical protein